MGLHTETEGIIGAEERKFLSDRKEAEVQPVRNAATDLAASVTWLPDRDSSEIFARVFPRLAELAKRLSARTNALPATKNEPEELLALRAHTSFIETWVRNAAEELTNTSLPVVSHGSEILPRVLAIAVAFIKETGADFTKNDFTAFCLAFEAGVPLKFHEIGSLVPALKLVLLERIVQNGLVVLDHPDKSNIREWIRTYQQVIQTSWRDELESLIPFDEILRRDPAYAYAAMDRESRNAYRERVAQIARRSDMTEMEVARQALALAREAEKRVSSNPRIARREAHIGYYLVGDGTEALCRRVSYNPTFGERARHLLRTHPDEYLLVGICVLSFVILAGILWLLTPSDTPLSVILLSMLILLLPSSQAAVQLMNYLTTNLLTPTTLPKLDFTRRIPDDCVTLVAIPTLLLNETQVHHLIEEIGRAHV